MLLGVIVRDITDPFFAGAIEAASLEANRRGYNVVLGHAHQSADEAVALWGILEARHCDAILFLGDLRDRPELIEDLKDTSIPVVALWHGSRESGIPTVSVDNRAGMAAVVDHLVALGHRRIAFAGPKRLGDITEREAAYLAVARAPRTARTARSTSRMSPTTSPAASRRSTAHGPAPSRRRPSWPPRTCSPSACCMPRSVAACECPRDVSVSGFDDIPVAAVSVPALTTVRMPTEAMIVAAIDLVIGPGGVERDVHPVMRPSSSSEPRARRADAVDRASAAPRRRKGA